ncbi:MAG: M28 family peptidase [Bacteroidota bacterium]|nr:M28 family peptidase [Bacteroidota bacterium]
MSKRLTGLLAFLLLILAVWISFNFDQPNYHSGESMTATAFSTDRALKHVEKIGNIPHYVGSAAHSEMRNYIVDQLQEMGLEVQTQEGYNLDARGTLVLPENILARIKGSGNGNALILMTHYDSAPHSSNGASDAGSGVATILEGLRAFLEKETPHQNDIIILFTDAEELGLNGAELFVKDHPWARDAKLALNFEARGSGGNSFMLLETNGSNSRLIKAFKAANPKFPVSNSLAYSIYKMLPNDTDLTVLREDANINGYNFAFIDDHFDYHTAMDLPARLDRSTLKQQGSYLMPLLDYFKDADLDKLNSDRDLIYFNLPFGEFVTYPYDWIIPMLIVAISAFILLLIYGMRRQAFKIGDIFFGFLPMLISLIASGIGVWLFWKACLFLYPGYDEILQGFPYNGYNYLAAGILLAIGICFYVYHLFRKKSGGKNLFIAPLLLWIIVCALLSVYLTGASYFLLPVFFGLIQLFVMIRQEKPNRALMALLCFPAIVLIAPFVWNLPVALGLKMLFASGILAALLFLLHIPVFGYFKKLKTFGTLCLIAFAVLVIIAHFRSGFNENRPKPNSLVYVQDLDEKTANFYSYDHISDDWTEKIFGDDPQVHTNPESNFSSKYGNGFTFSTEAPMIDLPQPSVILSEIENDTANISRYSMKIAPNRPVNRIEIYELNDINFQDFSANGLAAGSLKKAEETYHVHGKRWQERVLTYYVTNRDTLRLEFSFENRPDHKPKFVIYESAYDLIGNRELGVEKRPKGMIPKPFILNDATILKKTVSLEKE